jgi:hypothetical protein
MCSNRSSEAKQQRPRCNGDGGMGFDAWQMSNTLLCYGSQLLLAGCNCHARLQWLLTQGRR